MRTIKHFLFIGIIFISSVNIFSQTSTKPALKIKVDKVTVLYRDLITDDKGAIIKKEPELYALNKFVKDSVIVWAKRFNLNDPEGFQKFAAYTVKRLDIKPGKRITINFSDISGKEESYSIWSLGNDKFKIEELNLLNRNTKN